MRPYILAENNWKTVKDSVYELAILPWGACEAHNYHLPYGTDIIEAEQVAAEAARIAWEKGAKVTVLPVIPFGVNTGQSDVLLDMNMNPSTQLAVLRDVVTVLNRQGIHKLVILNSHGGNDFRVMIRELGLQFPDMFLSQCNWYQALDQKEYLRKQRRPRRRDGDQRYTSPHASPGATAGRSRRRRLEEIRVYRHSRRLGMGRAPLDKSYTDTGVGDPRQATAGKGERYFKAVTEKVGQYFYEVASTSRDNLYR